VLSDVVTVIRAFRPHVIIAVFSGTPRDGHGQHQVSGIVAREGYDASGDTVRFPVARYGAPWTAAKFYRDRSYFGGGENALPVPVGTFDPLLGVTYAEIAAASRSQHRSQGFGNIIGPPGPVTGYVYREATRVNDATPAGRERSMFDGIDTSWTRVAALVPDPAGRAAIDSIAPRVARARESLRTAGPQHALADLEAVVRLESDLAARLSVPSALASLRSDAGSVNGAGGEGGARVESHGPAAGVTGGSGGRMAAPLDPDLARTLQVGLLRANRAAVLAAGLEMHATVAHDVAAVGMPVLVTTALENRAMTPLTVGQSGWITATANGDGGKPRGSIAPDSGWRDSTTLRDTVVSQPWWLRTPRTGDLFSTPVSRVAEDERPAAATVEVRLRDAGSPPVDVTPQTAVVQRLADPGRGEVDLPLSFVPAVTLTLDRTVEYVPARTRIDRVLRVLLRSGLDSAADVAVTLRAPSGLAVDSATRRRPLAGYGMQHVDFHVTGMLPAGDATLGAQADTRGTTYRLGYIPIDYEHIRPQKLYRPAELHLSVVDVKVPPRLVVGYIPGVGDNVEPMLEQLGLHVTVLDPASLGATDLSRFTTIVIGPRAYEASPALVASNARLLGFVRSGGTLVVQYGQFEMAQPGILPYPITLSRPADRVTDETAPVRILDAAAGVLNWPNKIRPHDFDGWVQERSSYMPHTFDSHYHSVMSMNDPGEPANDAAILVAPLGGGTFVYTTLSFFRQLPAGVPGPARLFVNLLAAGSHHTMIQ
jgi:hypothetical protein